MFVVDDLLFFIEAIFFMKFVTISEKLLYSSFKSEWNFGNYVTSIFAGLSKNLNCLKFALIGDSGDSSETHNKVFSLLWIFLFPFVIILSSIFRRYRNDKNKI